MEVPLASGPSKTLDRIGIPVLQSQSNKKTGLDGDTCAFLEGDEAGDRGSASCRPSLGLNISSHPGTRSLAVLRRKLVRHTQLVGGPRTFGQVHACIRGNSCATYIAQEPVRWKDVR